MRVSTKPRPFTQSCLEQCDQHRLFFLERGLLRLSWNQRHVLLCARHAAWVPACTEVAMEQCDSLRTLFFPPQRGETAFFRCFGCFALPRVGREMVRHLCCRTPSEESAHAFRQALRTMLPHWEMQQQSLHLPVTDHPRLLEITAFIRKHCDEALTMPALCRRFGLSERSMFRLFRSELGLSFRSYLRMARIVLAMDLLAGRNWSVTDTAYEVGYNSLCAFSDAFRALVGMRPREFAKSRPELLHIPA